MKNRTRTDLLNYLHDNNIKYKFCIDSQQVTIDLTVNKKKKEKDIDKKLESILILTQAVEETSSDEVIDFLTDLLNQEKCELMDLLYRL